MPLLNVVSPELLTVSVRLPVIVAVPEKVRSRLPAMVQLPPNVTALARVTALPLAWMVPPLMTRVPVPNAVALPTERVPLLRVVVPL